MEKKMEIKNKVVSAALIGAGLAIGGFSIGRGYYASHMNNRTVTVKGLAERDVKADVAVWTIKFQSTGNELAATQKKLNANMLKITQYLTKRGFADTEIMVGRINTNDLMANPYHDNSNGTRYILTQEITVRSNQVDLVEESLRAIGTLVADGVVFDNQEYGSPVAYLFTGLNDIKPVMLQDATQNARQAADEFAKSSNATVGKIRRANQGVFSILPREQTPGAEESYQINKTVRVVATIEYFLD